MKIAIFSRNHHNGTHISTTLSLYNENGRGTDFYNVEISDELPRMLRLNNEGYFCVAGRDVSISRPASLWEEPEFEHGTGDAEEE